MKSFQMKPGMFDCVDLADLTDLCPLSQSSPSPSPASPFPPLPEPNFTTNPENEQKSFDVKLKAMTFYKSHKLENQFYCYLNGSSDTGPKYFRGFCTMEDAEVSLYIKTYLCF